MSSGYLERHNLLWLVDVVEVVFTTVELFQFLARNLPLIAVLSAALLALANRALIIDLVWKLGRSAQKLSRRGTVTRLISLAVPRRLFEPSFLELTEEHLLRLAGCETRYRRQVARLRFGVEVGKLWVLSWAERLTGGSIWLVSRLMRALLGPAACAQFRLWWTVLRGRLP